MSNYKVGEFAEKIGVSVSTLQRWDRTNVLKSRRTPTNQRYYTDEDLNKVLNLEQETESKRKNVGYCRVSTQGQKKNLENQQEFVSIYSLNHGVILDEIYTDIGSGLNYNRKGFNSILYSEKKQKILISYKDRFVRFGYSWFDNFLKSKGSEIIVVNNQTSSPKQELVEDLISIIQIFSCRIDGLKKYKKKIKNDEGL